MAESIEGREPMLDHRLVEFAMSLPQSAKHGVLGTKHILRRILYRHVPRELVDRPKQGFSVPMVKWLRSEEHTSELQSLMRISYAVFCLKKKKKITKKKN